jgi:hypothetical protein
MIVEIGCERSLEQLEFRTCLPLRGEKDGEVSDGVREGEYKGDDA